MHDSFIIHNSAIFMKFENDELRNGWLLGDSGHPLLPWLNTPIINPQTRPDNRYNRKQKSTRNVVERAIGVWKISFAVLISLQEG